MDLQAGGYAAWVLALKQKGQVNQIDEVVRRSHAKLSEQNCIVAPLFYDWPAGTYGLPKTTGGCPLGWKDGQYDYKGDNSFHFPQNAPVHFNGSISNNTLKQGYCMKTHSMENGTGSSWPKGSYCILKYGRGCPAGFALGKLGFLGGTKTGEVPD
ncbi:Hypp735 [Branchiostoma lanceolatum]|uniref:Hypp735 protein n=1 Tax=Branchiostoma lanceolatum TaxID=7740 RepID=A0A8J9VBG4_BRALA|nr:Hypp735 [Branchiostoma lanceolatum]